MKLKVKLPIVGFINVDGKLTPSNMSQSKTGKTLEEIGELYRDKAAEKFKDYEVEEILVEYNEVSRDVDGTKVECSEDNDAKELKFNIILAKKKQAQIPKEQTSTAKNYRAAARSFLAISKFLTTIALMVENEFYKDTLPVRINDLTDILRSNIFMTRAVLLGGGAAIGLAYAYKSYNDKEENKWPALVTAGLLGLFVGASGEMRKINKSLIAGKPWWIVIGTGAAIELAGMVSAEYLSGSDFWKGVEKIKSGYYQGFC